MRIAGGRVTGIREYDEDVFSRGYIRPKGANALLAGERDPLPGNAVLSGVPIELVPA